MNTVDRISLIESVIESYKAMDFSSTQLNRLLGATVDSPALNSAWQAFDKLVDTVANLVGDESNWIAWFIWENGCGDKGLVAGYGNKLHRITNVRELVKLIEKGLK